MVSLMIHRLISSSKHAASLSSSPQMPVPNMILQKSVVNVPLSRVFMNLCCLSYTQPRDPDIRKRCARSSCAPRKDSCSVSGERAKQCAVGVAAMLGCRCVATVCRAKTRVQVAQMLTWVKMLCRVTWAIRNQTPKLQDAELETKLFWMSMMSANVRFQC